MMGYSGYEKCGQSMGKAVHFLGGTNGCRIFANEVFSAATNIRIDRHRNVAIY
jgi:hypothetical protein